MAHVTTSSPVIDCSTAPLEAIDVELIVIPWFEQEEMGPFKAIDRAAAGEITRALSSREFEAKLYDIFVTPIADSTWRARRMMLIGAGSAATFTPSVARRLATAAVLAARQRRIARMAFLLRAGVATVAGDVDVAGIAQAIAEGLALGDFDAGEYKTAEPSSSRLSQASIVLSQIPDTSPDTPTRVEGAVARGRLLGDCSNLARGLTNAPGNALTPREFASRAASLAAEGGVDVQVLDEHQIEQLGMGLLLGVARGSSEPPRLMVFRHEPFKGASGPVLGLVGKGITFDTGGISIKPADGMERMKDDMAGGAAVASAMRAISMLKAPLRVVGVVPATENMPGGRAIKPGDILKSAEGKTVEVINTDAEGRLVLGDGLWYARRLGATHLVDVATLTGAVVVALGKLTSGIFGTPDEWVDQVRRVAERAGDRVWPMPLVEEYRDQLKSDIADFTNTGGRPAGSITAALFLKEFTGGLPWVHMDIAGTAWAEEARPYQPKGATGAAARTLAELAFTADSWPR
jgi:leucyl aminopeptidase